MSRTRRCLLLVAAHVVAVALDAPTAFWTATLSGQAFVEGCWPSTAPFPYQQLRPRYSLSVGTGDERGTQILALGAEAPGAAADWRTQVIPAGATFPYTMLSEDAGRYWTCNPSVIVPEAQRYAAVTLSAAAGDALSGCKLGCIAGGADLIGTTPQAPTTSGVCTKDGGSLWQTPLALQDPAALPVLGAAAATNGSSIYLIGGVMRNSSAAGAYIPAGVWQVQLDTGAACDVISAQQLYTDDELPVGLRGRMFMGAAFFPARDVIAVVGGCTAASVPGIGTPPIICSTDDMWMTPNANDPQRWLRVQLSGSIASPTSATPPLLAELRDSTDMMLPFNDDFVRTPFGAPGLLLHSGGVWHIAQDASSSTPFLPLSSELSPYGPLDLRLEVALTPFLYTSGRPNLVGYANGTLLTAGVGNCSATCEPGRWGAACYGGEFRPTCVLCTTDCGAGQFIAAPCTDQGNALCMSCFPCELPQVQVGGCDGIINTMCAEPSASASATPTASTSSSASSSVSPSSSASASASASASTTASPSRNTSATVTAATSSPSVRPEDLDPRRTSSKSVPLPDGLVDFVVAATITSCVAVLMAAVAWHMPGWHRKKPHVAAGHQHQAGSRGAPDRDPPHDAASAWAFPLLVYMLSLWWHIALAAMLFSSGTEAGHSIGAAVVFFVLIRAFALVVEVRVFASRSSRPQPQTAAVRLLACMRSSCLLLSPSVVVTHTATELRAQRHALHARLLLLVIPVLLLDAIAAVQFIDSFSNAWLLSVACMLAVAYELISTLSRAAGTARAPLPTLLNVKPPVVEGGEAEQLQMRSGLRHSEMEHTLAAAPVAAAIPAAAVSTRSQPPLPPLAATASRRAQVVASVRAAHPMEHIAPAAAPAAAPAPVPVKAMVHCNSEASDQLAAYMGALNSALAAEAFASLGARWHDDSQADHDAAGVRVAVNPLLTAQEHNGCSSRSSVTEDTPSGVLLADGEVTLPVVESSSQHDNGGWYAAAAVTAATGAQGLSSFSAIDPEQPVE